jgi:hypothetical protein
VITAKGPIKASEKVVIQGTHSDHGQNYQHAR